MSTNDEIHGLPAAVDALQGVRQEWRMETLIGFWDTPGGRVAIVVDADGHDLFANDEPLPRMS